MKYKKRSCSLETIFTTRYDAKIRLDIRVYLLGGKIYCFAKIIIKEFTTNITNFKVI